MKAEGNEAKFGIEVFGVGGFEHMQARFHGEAGGDYENIFGVALVLRVGDFVQDLPGDEHGHDDGFARAGGHFGAEAGGVSAVRGDVNAGALGGGGFGEPDEGFYGFGLAEEKAAGFALLRLTPVFAEGVLLSPHRPRAPPS